MASRKDLRDAITAARAAQSSWQAATPYLRGQILYRIAEIAETRRTELLAALEAIGAVNAAWEVDEAIDRLVYFCGWSDKFSQVYGAVNPVSSPHFAFTYPEPVGVVGILCPDAPALLAMIAHLSACLCTGNTVVLLAPETAPHLAVTFAEILATSDVPAGVVNILTGARSELAEHFATHMDLDAVIDASGDSRTGAAVARGASLNFKRCTFQSWADLDDRNCQPSPLLIEKTIEMKTVWHPRGA